MHLSVFLLSLPKILQLMTIKDRANDFIGHPPEVDEGYETSMRRNAYIKGFEDAVDFFKQQIENETFKNMIKELYLYGTV